MSNFCFFGSGELKKYIQWSLIYDNEMSVAKCQPFFCQLLTDKCLLLVIYRLVLYSAKFAIKL